MRRTLLTLAIVLTAVSFVACSEIVPGMPDTGTATDSGTATDGSVPTDAPMSGA